MKHPALIASAIMIVLSGCTLQKPEHNDLLTHHLPDTFSETAGTQVVQEQWWESFESPELNQLMEEAFSDNLNLAQYAARLNQQAALADKAGAAGLPTVSGSASAGTTWPDISEDNRTDAFRLGLSAAYEVDLWGRVNATTEAALNNLNASRYDLQSARITLSANITQSWLSIVAQQRRLDLLKQQLEANLDTVELLKVRQRNGIATALEVYQQQQTVDSTRAMIPAAELQRDLQKSQLAVLLGRSNASDLAIQTASVPDLPPQPASGIPSDLLQKRPDLQSEFERLTARDYAVAIARADRLPTLTLTGSVTDSETQFSDLLDNWAGNLAAGLAAPLFDGGRRKAEVDYQLARVEEGVALYRQKVITAISEVDNALLQERKTAEQLALQRRQLKTLERQLNEAGIRYRRGLADYLNVLAALTSKQNLERTLISTELNLYSARIELYRALGGSVE